jgi:hypothetical protein
VTTAATEATNTFVLGYAHDWDNYVTWTPGIDFDMLVLGDGNGAGFITALEGKVSRGTGPKTISFTKNFTTGTWGAIALVFKATLDVPRLAQHISTSGTALSVSATFPYPVKAGDMIIACATSASFNRVSDNLNGTYGASSSYGVITCQRFFGSAGGNITVTLYQNSTGFMSLAIFNVAGKLSTCYDGQSGPNGNSSTISISTGTLNKTTYTFLVSGSYWFPEEFANFTIPTSGWTVRENIGLSGGKYRMVYADLDQKNGVQGTRSVTVNADSNLVVNGIMVVSCK